MGFKSEGAFFRKMEYKKLGEIADITKLAGFEFTKYVTYIPDGDIIAIRALNLKNGRLALDDVKRISVDVSKSLPRSQLRKYDIVLSYTGTVGESAQIMEDNLYHLAPNVAKVTPDTSKVNPVYLFQYIRSPEFKQEMLNYAHGSTQMTIPMKVIRELSVPVFNMDMQNSIASVLASLDDKIALNARINDNLQQQADAIFSENFSLQELLPVGWRKSYLSSIAKYLNGLAMQKYRPAQGENGLPVLKIKELRQGMTDDNSERCSANIKPEYIVHDGDIIFSWSGSLLVDFWCGGDCGLNQHLFKVTSMQFEKWFIYAWTKHYLDYFIAVAADKATTMGHIKRDELDKAEVIIPSSSDYMKIGSLMQPLYDKIISNRIESRKLSELRDALLPRLMSGELDVSGVILEDANQ